MSDQRYAGLLSEQVIAITGAASGVGLAVAQAAAAAGARLALLDRDLPALERATVGLSAEEVMLRGVDIADPSSVDGGFAAIAERFGALHGLFNNAGVALVNESERIEDVSDEAWAFMLAVNLTGCFLCCRAATGLIEASGGGSIVNNASTAALVAEPGLEAYSAAKGGVLALTRAAAASAARRGVRVNAVCPGLLETPMAAAIGSPLAQRLRADTLLDVAGPEAMRGLVVYLLSSEASYMTGSVVVIDGGLTVH